MTILVAYVARPEGEAALDKGIEIATRRNEALVVVNAGPGGRDSSGSVIDGYEGERLAERLTRIFHACSQRRAQRGIAARI